MKKLEEHIKEILKRYPADTYFIACSGGIDSTVLLHLMHSCGVKTQIAHVNYHLRGDDSNEDEAFLSVLSENLSLSFQVRDIDLAKELKTGGNLQQKAREVRYDFFLSLLEKNPNSAVMLAHHSEDQTETFFMNLVRDSGVMGLAAMPEKRGAFIRPLLPFSKTELVNYAKENNISWREDASNASLKYTRNQWRNKVLPELRKTIPTLDTSIQVLTKAFQDEQRALEEKVKPIYQHINTHQQLEVEVFSKLNHFEKIELCRQLGQSFGILITWDTLDLKGTKIELNVNSKCPFDAIVFDGAYYSFLANTKINTPQLNFSLVTELPLEFTKDTIYLDEERMIGSLAIRKPEVGERIHPIGMQGSRLISDVVSDAKLDSLQKQKLHVVSDDANILWIPGLCISRKALANQKSTRILKVSIL